MTRQGTYRAHTFLWWWLVTHTRVLQQVGPLAAGASVTVFQMLPEVVSTEELLGLVTFAKLVNMIEMLRPHVPVGGVREFIATISANVSSRGTGR